MSKETSVVAKRYALALYDIVGSANLEKTVEELRLVKELLDASNELKTVLTHPKISVSQKKQLVKDTLGAELSTPVLNTIYLLVDRKRISAIGEMASKFFELANEAQGIADAVVYSVRPLTDGEEAELEQAFAKRIGKKALRIENIVDPSIIGGVKIRIGNRIYDGTVSGKLERIERQLASN